MHNGKAIDARPEYGLTGLDSLLRAKESKLRERELSKYLKRSSTNEWTSDCKLDCC